MPFTFSKMSRVVVAKTDGSMGSCSGSCSATSPSGFLTAHGWIPILKDAMVYAEKQVGVYDGYTVGIRGVSGGYTVGIRGYTGVYGGYLVGIRWVYGGIRGYTGGIWGVYGGYTGVYGGIRGYTGVSGGYTVGIRGYTGVYGGVSGGVYGGYTGDIRFHGRGHAFPKVISKKHAVLLKAWHG